jgi:hypothetical protein
MPLKPKCVYFIQHGEDGPIKIGFTANFSIRFASIRSVNIFARVLGIMPGGRKEEQKIHERFQAHRIEGEWFRPADEIVQLARSLPKEPPQPPTQAPVVFEAQPPKPIQYLKLRKPRNTPKKSQLTHQQRSENVKRGARLAKQRRLEKIHQPVTPDEINGPLERCLRGFRGGEFRAGPFLKYLGLEYAKQAYDLTRKRMLELGWKRVLTNHGHGAVAEHFVPPLPPSSWREAYEMACRDRS